MEDEGGFALKKLITHDPKQDTIETPFPQPKCPRSLDFPPAALGEPSLPQGRWKDLMAITAQAKLKKPNAMKHSLDTIRL